MRRGAERREMYRFPANVERRLLEAARCDEEPQLLELMLLLSEAIDDDFDVDDCRDRIDELGAVVDGELHGLTDPAERVERFVTLMRGIGFRGNREHYFDPRNSVLSEVIERRTGIPISLSVLFMEVGRYAGVELRGVGFPYHFMLRAIDVPDCFVDPFFGTCRSTDSCRQLLDQVSGGTIVFRDEFLSTVDSREIFVRVLRNLKEIHKQAGAVWIALAYCDMILEFDPEQPVEYRDRGTISLATGEWNRAVDDLSTYLAMSPTAPDRETVLGQLQYVLQQQKIIH